MFKLAIFTFALSFLAGCQSMNCCDTPPDSTCGPTHLGHLRHVVLFKFKPATTPEKIKEIEAAFATLPGKIPSIIDFEWGTDVGVENLSRGYTHCFLVTFKDAKGREEYLPHPAHKAFVELAGPHFDEVHVIDFVAK